MNYKVRIRSTKEIDVSRLEKKIEEISDNSDAGEFCGLEVLAKRKALGSMESVEIVNLLLNFTGGVGASLVANVISKAFGESSVATNTKSDDSGNVTVVINGDIVIKISHE